MKHKCLNCMWYLWWRVLSIFLSVNLMSSVPFEACSIKKSILHSSCCLTWKSWRLHSWALNDKEASVATSSHSTLRFHKSSKARVTSKSKSLLKKSMLLESTILISMEILVKVRWDIVKNPRLQTNQILGCNLWQDRWESLTCRNSTHALHSPIKYQPSH